MNAQTTKISSGERAVIQTSGGRVVVSCFADGTVTVDADATVERSVVSGPRYYGGNGRSAPTLLIRA
jgi:hypothetical protein